MTTSTTPIQGTASRSMHPAGRVATPLAGPLDVAVLEAIATGLAVVVGDHSAGPLEVQRTRLLTTPAYDAWLMVWGAGATADAHDHAGSVCVAHVVHGALRESATELTDSASVTRMIPAGITATLGATSQHTLANVGAASTVSIHVFSPPLGDH